VEEDYLINASQLDSAETELLIQRYWHDVWQYAFFLTRREHLADDIAQDTFIQAIRAINHFRGHSKLRTWLLTIARNTSYNYMKSAFLKKVVLIGFWKDTRNAASAEAAYFSAAAVEDIWKTVLELPRIYREVLILDVHYGLSHAEIADLLGIRTGTVKSRLNRARIKLGNQIKEDERL